MITFCEVMQYDIVEHAFKKVFSVENDINELLSS